MPKAPRGLLTIAALAGLSSLVFAQTGPQLTVSPGLIYTVASRATNGLSSSAKFNAAVFKSPATVYVADAHANLAYVYAVDLVSGQVKVLVGKTPDPVNGNIASCTAGGPSTGAVCPGDNGPAINAQLYEPAGLALDSAGNLFVADDRQNVIRRVDATTGVITTVAGIGVSGLSGDNGLATRAGLSAPTAIAFDSANNLYIADTLNHRIRVVTASNQIINTFAGTTMGFGGDGGPATNAQLNLPNGVAVDRAGNVFIADSGNHAIREVTGGSINTFAGQGGVAGYTGDGGPATSARLHYPFGVAVDAGGALYISDNNNNAIRKVTGDASHTISTIAGNGTSGYSGDGGSALNAFLNSPSTLSIDGQNNLYFVDNGFTAIRRILSTAAPFTLPFAGSSPFPLTLSNTGDQPLTIAPFALSNANFATASGGTCPAAGGFKLNVGASCTLPITYSTASGGGPSGTLTITSNTGGQANATTDVVLSKSSGLHFVPVSPCRVVDTRLPDPTFGGGPYAAGEIRTYAIRNSAAVGCGSAPIPTLADVQAYSLNVTVVPHGILQFLTVYPSGTARPGVSTLNSYDGRVKANAAIIPANVNDNPSRSISIYANDPTDVIVDINGYYVPEGSSVSTTNGQTPLAYYPLPPCRAVDTRPNTGLKGQGDPLLGGSQKDYSLTNVCSLPSAAQAYALNFTALPRNGPIGYITVWPTNSSVPRPVVSTLNATTGIVTANAAIVPSGTSGSISAFSTQDADLIIDVAGYYAPPTSGGLALYNVAPCRAFDSRTAGSSPLTGGVAASQNIASGGDCRVPATAQSYVLNATVLPGTVLQYLTAWAQGSAQPVQSVLNAYDQQVTSNLAVVPTINGSISTYADSSTGLILDLSAYFAP